MIFIKAVNWQFEFRNNEYSRLIKDIQIRIDTIVAINRFSDETIQILMGVIRINITNQSFDWLK